MAEAVRSRRATIEALRAEIGERFREAIPASGEAPGPALSSGWERVDALLPHGGLRPGESLAVEAAPGAGGVALLSSWVRAASRAGEPAAVVDPSPSCLPHPWVEPEDGDAPIWIVTPTPADFWPAVDVLLRSGAFGLLALVEPPTAPTGVGPRLSRLLRKRSGRLLVLGQAPFPPSARLCLRTTALRWCPSPLGEAPTERQLSITSALGHAEVHRDDTRTDRLRAAPRAADRRTPHSGGGVGGRGKSRR